MAKKKKKKKSNGKLKANVGGKADVHLNNNGGRNKSLLGHNAIFTPEVIDDIHIKSQFFPCDHFCHLAYIKVCSNFCNF